MSHTPKKVFINKILMFLLLCSMGCMLGSCALPVPIGSELNGFVPNKELQIVSLAREGMALFNTSRFYEAEARFRKALFLDPSLDNIKFNLATTLERIGLYAEAESIYKALIKQEGENALLHAALGRLYIAQFDYDNARKEFYRALSLANTDDDKKLVATLNQSLITLEFGVGHIDEAICLAREISTSAKSPESLVQYIRLLLSAGLTQQASDALETSSDIAADDSPNGIYLRTLVWFAMGKNEDAQELSERLLAGAALDPSMDFELRIINLNSRYIEKEPGLLEQEDTQNFIKILSESIKSSALTSLYWSPVLLVSIQEMLNDPRVLEILDD